MATPLITPQWVIDEIRASVMRNMETSALLHGRKYKPMGPLERAYYQRKAAERHVSELRTQHEALTGTVIAVERLEDGYVLHYEDGRRVTLRGAGNEVDQDVAIDARTYQA